MEYPVLQAARNSGAVADSDMLEAIPVVRQAVRRYGARVPASVDREELFAAGLLGLVQARETFRPEIGTPFAVHARSRVAGAILDDLRRRDVMSRSQRASARLVVSAMKRLDSNQPTRRAGSRIDDIAHLAGLAPSDVRDALDNLDRANRWRRSLETSDAAVAERLSAPTTDPSEDVLERELMGEMRACVERLPPRLRAVIENVYFSERQTQDVAAEMGVTPSRVSQLCAEALRRIESDLRRAGIEPARRDSRRLAPCPA